MSTETTSTADRPEQDRSTWAERQLDAARAEAADLAAATQSKAVEGLGLVQTSVKREVGAVARRQQSQIGLRVSALAEALTDAAVTLDQRNEPWTAARVHQAASLIQDASTYLDAKEPGEVADDLRSFARRHPRIFYGALLAVGVGLGRFLRSTSPDELRSRDTTVEAQPTRPVVEVDRGADSSVDEDASKTAGARETTAETSSTITTESATRQAARSHATATYGAPPPEESTYVHSWR